jgi:hypothetical protein
MGKGLKNFVANRGQGTRIGLFNRVNNIVENIAENRRPGSQVGSIIKSIPVHSRALLLVDTSFEIRYLPLLRHLIDVGYIPDSIDIKIVKDNIVDVEAVLTVYYNNGGRLIFGAQKSSVFIGLCSWFEKHSDTIYFNYGSKIWIKGIDDHIPDNMITTSCNYYRIVEFIFKHIMCNLHQLDDILPNSPFANIFDYVDDINILENGQVFNQIVHVCDHTDLRLKNNFIDVVNSYIETNFSDKVMLQTFVLNIAKDATNGDGTGDGTFVFPDELDALLTKNPINGEQFGASDTKSIFIFDCFDSANCQNMLKYFSKKEYSNNLIIFSDNFLNLNVNNGLPFYSKINFTYAFILALSHSELGYKTSKHLFKDYSVPLPFIDTFLFILNIFDRIVNSGSLNITGRLIEYLTNSFSIDMNEWHVKPLYLYGLNESFDDKLGIWNFNPSVSIFKKSFNYTMVSTAGTDETWMDNLISGYPFESGVVSYSTNNNNYNASNLKFFNTNLNGVYMLFSNVQEISDYTSNLTSFFNGTYTSRNYPPSGFNPSQPSSTSAVFGMWKCLSNSALVMNTTSVPTISINVTLPSQALIDGSSCNKNYWLHAYYGPISYTYYSYNVHGALMTGSFTDTVTIDLNMTYSTNNYIVFFNKGNIYYDSSGNAIRGPLRVYFTLYANQVINKQYRIGDIVSISSSSLGSINASVDTISSDGFTLGVTRFEDENTNGITSTVLKQNTGLVMSLANNNSIAKMGVNPDITNVANNSLNLWSGNGCYYLALVPSGWVVANDYRTGQTFWSSGSGFANPGPGTLQFRVSTHYLIIDVLDSAGLQRNTILNYNVSSSLLVYPLQLTITNDRNIAILNANGVVLWSESSGIYLSLTNGAVITSNGNYGSLYSLNGSYNLTLAYNGMLSFTHLSSSSSSSSSSIYSITNSTATSLKFSYTTTTNTNSVANFALGLYNSSGSQVYNILANGSFTNSTTFDVENNKLGVMPFVAPYTFKLSNNGDLVIVDANNNKCWCLGKADKTTVTQDSYTMINSVSTLTSNTNTVTGLSSLHPRQGDSVTIHNPVNLLYNGATATIAVVNSDKSIKALFYDEDDITMRSKILKLKPELITSLVSYPDETSGELNFNPVSDLELFNLTSSNGYYSANINNNGIVRIKDNRTGRENWKWSSLTLENGETIRKCNGLKIDDDTGSLYVDIITENVGNPTSSSQNVNLTSNVNYTLEFYASSLVTVTIAPSITNPLQPLITFTFTPTNSDLTLFTQSFSTVTTGTFTVTFSSASVKNISINNEDKYYLFENSGENILDGDFDSTVIPNNSYISYTNQPLNNWTNVQGWLLNSFSGNSYPIPYPNGNYAFSFGQGSGLTQNIYLLAGSNYILSFFASSYIGSNIYPINIVVTIKPQTVNSSQKTISYTFSPINAWQQFSQLFSINASDNYTVSFIASGTVTGYNAIQAVSILTNTSSYSLDMQDDGNLCIYQNGSDGVSSYKWGSGSWQTENWTSNTGVFQAFEYWNPLSPPKVISTNGYYYLSMDYGTLGIMSYKNGGYNWVDAPFGYIGMPLFYSSATGMTVDVETSTSTTYYTVYNNGSVYTNANNSGTNGYWKNIYNGTGTPTPPNNSGIMNFFSPAIGPVVANNVQVVWTNSTATTGNGSENGKYLSFKYTYNNTTGKWIWSQLWVSVLSSCNVYINNTLIGAVGGSSSSYWNNLSKFDFNLPPGNTTFKFVAYNSSGRAGLAFLCIPKYISSCDLYISGNNGNLMVQNVTVLTEDNYTVTVPGVSDLSGYSITNFSGTGPGPYTMSFDDDGSGGSDGTLSIINGLGATIFSSNSGASLDASLPGPDDRRSILNSGVKLHAQQDESELQSFLWSSSGYSFFGVYLDTVVKAQTICIFDVRFTKPVYTFYTNSYTTLTSCDAISYLMVSGSGAIVAYNLLGDVMWKTANISGYSNYRLTLNDSNVLSIIANNSSGSVVTLTTFNQTWGTYKNTLLSYWTGSAYYGGRVLTSSSGDYILSLDNGSLNINNVIDSSYSGSGSSSSSSSHVKDINNYTLYSQLYKYTGTSPSNVHVRLMPNGTFIVCQWPTSYLMWGISLLPYDSPSTAIAAQSYSRLPDGNWVYMYYQNPYTKMVTDTGEARYYNGPISAFNVNNWSTYTLNTGHYNLNIVPLYTFGTSNAGIPGYKLVLGNTGELAIYDCSIPMAAAIDSCSVSNGRSAVLSAYNNKLYIGNYGYNNYRWIWNTANSSTSSVPVGTVNFYTNYTNTRTTDITATLYYSVDDTLDVYMNGIKLTSGTVPLNVVWAVTITLKAGTTSLFKFVATNGGSVSNTAGLIFWCLENGNTNDNTNTLFFSNTNTVYCSDGIVMGPGDFGIQTWSSGTAYSETIPYPNYTIDTSDIPENQLVSNEFSFKIPSSDSDTEEYTKIYSQNRLYYLRLEIDGSLAIYLSVSEKRIWSNGRPYSGAGANNAARIGFVYDSNGNGTFGLWDSKGLSYGNTIPVLNGVVYVFYLGNDRIMRLVGADGSSVVFNP